MRYEIRVEICQDGVTNTFGRINLRKYAAIAEELLTEALESRYESNDEVEGYDLSVSVKNNLRTVIAAERDDRGESDPRDEHEEFVITHLLHEIFDRAEVMERVERECKST